MESLIYFTVIGSILGGCSIRALMIGKNKGEYDFYGTEEMFI